MASNGDNHTPHDGRWAFDESVTKCFDAMLQASIPEYEAMRRLTYALGRNFLTGVGGVVDLGASRGEAIAPFTEHDNHCYAIEISNPMLAVLRERFATSSNVSVLEKDLRQIDPNFTPFLREKNCLVLSILTLQFVPIEYRQRIVDTVYRSLSYGGAFIIVEKVLGNSGDLDKLFVDEYYAMKNKNGYSYEDIQRKKASLEGVLVPVTDKWNRDLLQMSGFSQVDCFYRHLNFEGLIAIK